MLLRIIYNHHVNNSYIYFKKCVKILSMENLLINDYFAAGKTFIISHLSTYEDEHGCKKRFQSKVLI